MTDAQKTELYEVLMKGVPNADTDEYAALLARLTRSEIERIEPVIDGWLIAAGKVGQRFADRKTEEQILHWGEDA